MAIIVYRMTNDAPYQTGSVKTQQILLFFLICFFVIFRSAPFVLFPDLHFDADQAINGLMAKHIADGSAFPLFFYGQKYMMAFEAWLAAPFMKILGPSVAALKLSLLLQGVVSVLLVYFFLKKDTTLRAPYALLSVSFLAIPSVVTSSRLMEAQGGNIEAILFVLLIWLLRNKIILFGLTAALGYMTREFVLYGIVSVVLIDMLEKRYAVPSYWRRRIFDAAVFVTVIFLAHRLAPLLSENYMGFGSPDLKFRKPLEVIKNGYWLAKELLPTLYGLKVNLLRHYNIIAGKTTGSVAVYFLSVAVGLAFCVRGLQLFAQAKNKTIAAALSFTRKNEFCLYLISIGTMALGVYIFFEKGVFSRMIIRYVLLALLLPTGILGIYFRYETLRILRCVVFGGVFLLLVMRCVNHALLYRNCLTEAPKNAYRQTAEFLAEREIGTGRASYWISYHVSFLAKEKVRLTNFEAVRIRGYHRLYKKNRDCGVRIAEQVDGVRLKLPDGTEKIITDENMAIKRRQLLEWKRHRVKSVLHRLAL